MARSDATAWVLAWLALGVGTAHASIVDRVAAVVDGQVITLSDVYSLDEAYIQETCLGSEDTAACYKEAELRVLDALIERALVEAELSRQGVSISSADVDAAIDNIMGQYNIPDRATLRAEIEKQGNTWEEYRTSVADSIRLDAFQQRVLRSRITIREDELLDQYKRAVRALPAPLVAEIEAIGFRLPDDVDDASKVEALNELRTIVDRANAGQLAWDDLVASYDTAQLASVFRGQQFRRGQLTPELEPAVFDTEIGVIAAPVLAANTVYLIKPVLRKELPAEVPEFEEVRAQLEQQVAQIKMGDAQGEWLEAAKRRAAIRVLLYPDDQESGD